MSGRGIGKLGKPPMRYRVDRGVNARRCGFETSAQSQTEDLLRARRLLKAAKKYPELIDAVAAQALARKLEEAGEGGEVPESLASSTFMRGLRINVAGAIWQLIMTARLGR